MSKKIGLIGLMAAFLFSSVAFAEVGTQFNWVDKLCAIVGPVKICKPSKDWDTQKTEDYNARYKSVLHRGGANPVCWLRFDENPVGKTAHKYADWLKDRMMQRGLTEITQRKQVIDGRNVSFIGGYDAAKGFRYLVGVWRNREVGINLECTAESKDHAVYEPQFMSFITNLRIISEGTS